MTPRPVYAGRAWPTRLNMAVEVCDRWADRAPEKPAIITVSQGVTTTSYGDLRAMADALAHLLRAFGVEPRDRVAVLRSQSAWTAAAHVAIWKLGAISLPLFTLFGPDALAQRFADAGCSIVVTDPKGAEALRADPSTSLLLKTIVVAEEVAWRPSEPAFDTVPTAAEDPAVLIYTSGTTGAPKGALHAHRLLRGHLPGVELSHDLMPLDGDILWTPADWAWIGGLFDVLMPGLFHGVPVVAARMRKFDPSKVVEIVAEASVKNIFFPPTALRALRAADVTIAGLRSVASGGEPLGAELLEWGRHAFGLEINQFYGQTECNMVVSSCGVAFPGRAGALGRVVPGHDVQVIDDTGAPVEGEGEIAVRRGSPSMMLEYWNNPEQTAAKYRGEWMLTGDRGAIEDGYVRFIGRADDVITSSGYRIGPTEVEDCLLKHPAVFSAGVVGVPDAARTEIVTAFVVLRDPSEASDVLTADLQDHVKTRLAAHEYPRRIHFVEELPQTVTGKILRRTLRCWAMEDHGS